MANDTPKNIFTSDFIKVIAAEALAHLSDSLIIKPLCSTDLEAEYNVRPNGYKVGDTVNFKVDPVFEAKEFDEVEGVKPQSILSSNRSMTIEKHLDITTKVNAREKRLSFEGFSKEVIQPAAYALAEKVDQYMASKIHGGMGLYSSTDLFGSSSQSGGKDLAQARKVALMQQLGQNKFVLMNSELEASLLGQTWFTGAQNRGDDSILRNGEMGRTMGLDFFSSVNWEDKVHTNSSGVAVTKTTPAITENIVGSKILTVDAIATDKGFLVGDRIKVAGLKRPMIVAADAVATATTIVVLDPITELIPSGAAVTVVGTAAKDIDFQGAIFDSRALGVAMPMLDAPETGLSSVVSADGISIRVVADYNSQFKTSQLSMDCLIGGFALDPRRITILGQESV